MDSSKSEENFDCWDCIYFSQWIEDGKNVEFCEYYEKDISHRNKEICEVFIPKIPDVEPQVLRNLFYLSKVPSGFVFKKNTHY